MSSQRIPFFSTEVMHTVIREKMLAAMARVYDSQWYVLGEEVKQFEQAYNRFSQVAHTVGVGSGLEALTLALRALDIGRNDEVIVPATTYIATWLAVTQVGATPVPVEPELATSNLDPARIEAAITPRTRAIVPVHLYGQPCRMPEIVALARQYGLRVVEDNAQAHGAAWLGQLTGSFGDVNATSFYPTKNLGALGDAGAITTNDAEIAQQLRRLRNYGSTVKYQHEMIGYNSRLDELQAALLRVKLGYLSHWTAQRRQLAEWYQQHLRDIAGLRLPLALPETTHVYHIYVVYTTRRDELQRYLAAQDIETLRHYPVPPYQQRAYADKYKEAGPFPVTEELAATCLSLPLWPGMTETMVATVAKSIRAFYSLGYPTA